VSLSFKICSGPTVCPPNLEEGPQIFILLRFFDMPLRIFSATSWIVESCLRIIGSFVVGLWGSFV